jgi:EmrB/QacA subfamily drug resistance transporter
VTATAQRQHYGLTLAALVVGALAYSVSQTMVAPALVDIQHALHTSTTTVTWVLSAFLLTASVATPLLGRLGDMFGKERVLLWALVAFALGSLVAALSHSIGMLIAGRAIQGVGGAVFPLAFGIIRDEFPPGRVATGIGLISATFGIGGGAGLVLSGVVVENLSYEWIFWLGLVVVAAAVAATHLFVPESPIKSPARIDWGGAALMALGLVALLLGISEGNSWGWGSARIVGLFAASVVLLAAFVRYELRVTDPLVDMRLMKRRPVLTPNVTAFFVGFGMFGSFILIPQFVQVPTGSGYGFGASVTQAGVYLLPSALMMLVAGPAAGALGTRFGSKLPLLIGTLFAAASFVFLAADHGHPWTIYVAVTAMGAGIGFSFASMANLVVESVEQHQTGVATGINTILRTVGGSLGAQLAATLVAAQQAPGARYPAEVGFTHAFVLSAAGSVVAFAAALAVPSVRRRLAPAPT